MDTCRSLLRRRVASLYDVPLISTGRPCWVRKVFTLSAQMCSACRVTTGFWFRRHIIVCENSNNINKHICLLIFADGSYKKQVRHGAMLALAWASWRVRCRGWRPYVCVCGLNPMLTKRATVVVATGCSSIQQDTKLFFVRRHRRPGCLLKTRRTPPLSWPLVNRPRILTRYFRSPASLTLAFSQTPNFDPLFPFPSRSFITPRHRHRRRRLNPVFRRT